MNILQGFHPCPLTLILSPLKRGKGRGEGKFYLFLIYLYLFEIQGIGLKNSIPQGVTSV